MNLNRVLSVEDGSLSFPTVQNLRRVLRQMEAAELLEIVPERASDPGYSIKSAWLPSQKLSPQDRRMRLILIQALKAFLRALSSHLKRMLRRMAFAGNIFLHFEEFFFTHGEPRPPQVNASNGMRWPVVA